MKEELTEKFKLVCNKRGFELEQVTLKKGDTVFYDRLQKSMGIERTDCRIQMISENSPRYAYGSIDEIDCHVFMRILFLISALTGLEFKDKEKLSGNPVIEFVVL